MERFARLDTTTVVLLRDDVDTDQIIPARFLKTTTRDGLGDRLFADWRFDASGAPRADFPLNASGAASAHVLVVGRNFGCGSSREHAAWALRAFGFRAVVGLSFAEIFKANALKNGLLPVAVDADTHARLAATPGARVTVDLASRTLETADGARATFPIDPFARYCLLEGVDELDFLLAQRALVESYEANHAKGGRR
jgi:3-isopropylmalate/(R)-2-methylmalate dehydratase small subunit